MTRPFDPRLLTQVPSTRWPLLALGSIGVGQGLAAIALTFAVTTVVVAVVEGRPVLTACLWLVGLFVVRAVLAASSELVASWAGVRVSTILRERLVAAWLTRDGDSRPEAGRAQALANQGMTSVEPYVARYLPALVSGAFVPLLAIGTLAFVDWPSALIVVLTVPLLPVFAALIGHTTQESTQRRWRSLSALSGHFLDVMRGLPTLASYGRAQVQVESIATVSQGHRIATMKTLRLAFMSSAALELLATISVALVAVAVGLRLAYGTVPLDTAMLAILLAPEAYWPIRRIGTEFHAAADGAVALADALAEIDRSVTGHSPTGSDPAERNPTSPDPTGRHPTGRTLAESDHAGHDPAGRNAAHPDLAHPNTAGHNADERASPAPNQHTWPATVPVEPCSVVMDGVGYRFPGATASVLEDVSFTLTTGLTVVTGPSGAGKSTLLELMAGLRRPSTGDLTAPRAHLVSQRPFLAAGTIRDNLTLGNDSTDDELREILRVIGLDDLILALAQGLDTRLGDDGFGLSAGQRSRLTLARAALSNAPLILLDEPTAHLDDESATLAHDLIQNLALVRTVVAVTHRQKLQSIAHQHVRLDLRPAPDLAGSLP